METREPDLCLEVHTADEHEDEVEALRPLIKSENMPRDELRDTNLALLFPYLVTGDEWRIREPKEMAREFPKLWHDYLLPLKPILEKREGGIFAGEHFYQYSRQQNFIPLSKPKIITPDMADHVRFSFDVRGQFVFSGGAAGGNAIVPRNDLPVEVLLGILNSGFIEEQIKLN